MPVLGRRLLAALAVVLAVGGCATPRHAAAARPELGAPTALSRLHIAPPVNDGTYVRSAFGAGWIDADHNGCSTREDIMARDLVAKALNGCNVVAGTLRDPYTARVIRYSEHQSYTVQIDHIVPLAYAWRHGAEGWTRAQRVAFANDPHELLAVDGRANASKGDSGPGEWMPINKAFACTYARRFVAAAYTYRLTVTRADHDALQLALDTC